MKDIFLVDADDTILDFHRASENAIKVAMESMSVVWNEGFLTEFTDVNNGLWEALERKELTRAELIACRFPKYLQRVGLPHIDADAFNHYYLTHLANFPVYVSGAQEFLKRLNAMGRVFIVTNGTERIQKSRFTIAKLWDYAEQTFISDTIGADKPAKKYTEYVIGHIPRFDKTRAVWIGDSLSADIKAANEAEIDSIWFNPHKKPLTNKAKPTYITNSFEQIIDVLQRINGCQ